MKVVIDTSDEYLTVLSRSKFGLPQDILDRWRHVFNTVTISINPEISLEFPRDQKDAKFLECALSEQAEYLITSDKDFVEAKKLVRTTVLSVSQFKRLVCDRPI